MMREIHTRMDILKPRHARVKIQLAFDEDMTKDEVIEVLGRIAGKAMAQVVADFEDRQITDD